ncbi:hypothetical protein AVEN_180430-1 [Araneus ventricosus]|uniref:Uncharacterized protein n=1 Tax=Araneus ventricosus TaxID=182803 RepID=A0A4Y2RMV6_ARAVE|nr:hypothetical protein AVEN_180430-1 [Araneus ventricosus]
MLGIYYLCKKFETKRSIENNKRRDRKPKASTREDYECNICPEKERYIVKRDCERLETECVSSNSLPYNQKLRVDKLYSKNKIIRFITSQNKIWQGVWLLQKSIFRRFHDSGAVFYGHTKANMKRCGYEGRTQHQVNFFFLSLSESRPFRESTSIFFL